MAQANARALIFFLAASIGVVALVVLYRSDASRPAAVAATQAGAPAQASLGVRRASLDAARRDEGSDDDPADPVLPAAQPEAAAAPARDEPLPPPEPPIVPTAAAMAESSAILAARDQARTEVEGVLESRRQAIRNACWSGGGGPAIFPVQASFGADGGLLALSISDDRSAPAGVANCVRAQPLPLKIDAPGVGVTVDTKLQLP